MSVKILQGDNRQVLKTLPDKSVHCCVTSPPYWGLRDYGCSNQIGLEPTLDAYIENMRTVGRELWRVLRDDGTLWLNLGDCYASQGGERTYGSHDGATGRAGQPGPRISAAGLKPKDLVGLPWRVAFALQADGWYLRSDIIWHKPNPMPESVTDRCTKSHEYIFLLSKSARYYYDAAAIAEPVMETSLVRAESGVTFGGNNLCLDTRLQSGKEWIPKAEGANSRMNRSRDPQHEHEYNGKNRSEDSQSPGRRMLKNLAANRDAGNGDTFNGVTRNKRSVWTVPTAGYSGAHFATYPPALIRPCILAGCPMQGTVLDPFGGSGTVGEVAEEEGRNSILIELNPKYVELAERRTSQKGLFAQ